ncbi:hypothetical protein CEXT_268451 [Caerostris extrusa]|uniref:Uncharacterized protein n=1 Tax=Caerostris extrusa TaxID=172846 RepID=A0AAV4T044_CAEEX|nr:hypothetical protein CEXT_268451 [Caerostris extrusa]
MIDVYCDNTPVPCWEKKSMGLPGNLTAKDYLHNVRLGRWISIKLLAGSFRRIRAPSGMCKEVYAPTLSQASPGLLLHTLVTIKACLFKGMKSPTRSMLEGEKRGLPGNLTAKDYLHDVHLGRRISITARRVLSEDSCSPGMCKRGLYYFIRNTARTFTAHFGHY